MGTNMSPLGGEFSQLDNPFLRQLLTLQQDGNAAISAPARWGTEPILRVQTELDEVVDRLFSAIRGGQGSRQLAQWHFFVGSPGNGKSAGTGELTRQLLHAGFEIRDSADRLLNELTASQIPYELRIFEPGKPFPCGLIAQDASVVPDPYAEEANPATSLVELLRRAAEKGISLVVCTNRGVLERAFAAHYLDRTNASTVWFEAIRVSVMGQDGFTREFEGSGKKLFQSVSFSHTSLDRRSLLVSSQTFEQLVKKATATANWAICDGCSSKAMCPFQQNRRWLTDPKLGVAFVKAVRQAEVISGQIVVFREALALISFVLSGCPHDFSDGSPCQWVHSRLASSEIFSLLSRRIYMCLFSSYAPLGFEPFGEDQRAQTKAIAELTSALPIGSPAKAAFEQISSGSLRISSDVGVERLVGSAGIFRKIDPFADAQSNSFYERWDDGSTGPFHSEEEWVSDLERECAKAWDQLKETVEVRREGLGKAYRWLTRWISAFTYRAGAMVDLEFTFGGEIEQLVQVLSLADLKSDDSVRLVDDIQGELWRMLHEDDQGTRIAPFARLKGDWVKSKLRPRIDAGATKTGHSIVLQLKFGDQTQIPLSALAFVWLKRRIDRAMSDKRFPVEYLDTARDALIRAASESGYSLADSDLELVIQLPDKRNVRMRRSQGRVIIDGF